MAILTLLAGPTSTGKTMSIRNLDPKTTLWIKVFNKPSTFKENGKWKTRDKDGGNVIYTTDFELIKNIASSMKDKGFTKLVIDDANYLMINQFMSTIEDKGFDKFNDLAYNVWDLVKHISSEVSNDVRVYMTWHTEVDQYQNRKLKLLGKLIEEKIVIEGLLTLILETHVADGKFKFRTVDNGYGITKTPFEMFDEPLIDNDLVVVDNAIKEYYDIKE